jgi:hypothetical protein
MTRNRKVRVLFALIMVAIMLMPATVAYAGTGPQKPDGGPAMRPDGKGGGFPGATGPATPPPIAIRGPRLDPPVIPHSDVLDPGVVYNNLLVPPGLPAQSLEADAADGGRIQEEPGRGIRQTATGTGFGITLYDSPNVCANFNPIDSYAVVNGKSDIWTDWSGGWGPFAIDNGFYQAKNVAFTMERVVGPGNRYNDDEDDDDEEQASLKIASNQPYAAGYGSPIIPVPKGFEGGQVMVSVKYLIWDHDTGGSFEEGDDGLDYDWASMGIKAGAAGPEAVYVNGYVRGEWAELTNTIPLGHAPDVMVLLQAHSPGSFNSNIYFDDVKIAFIDREGNGKSLRDCSPAAALSSAEAGD